MDITNLDNRATVSLGLYIAHSLNFITMDVYPLLLLESFERVSQFSEHPSYVSVIDYCQKSLLDPNYEPEGDISSEDMLHALIAMAIQFEKPIIEQSIEQVSNDLVERARNIDVALMRKIYVHIQEGTIDFSLRYGFKQVWENRCKQIENERLKVRKETNRTDEELNGAFIFNLWLD